MGRRAGHPAFSALAALRKKKAEGVRKAAKAGVSDEDKAAEAKAVQAAKDAQVWQNAVRDVIPNRRKDGRIEPFVPQPLPVPRQRELGEARVLAESLSADEMDMALEGEEEEVYLAHGVPYRTLADLRRGRWVIQEELDLHGATREEARFLLNDFLDECGRRGLRCLRVIHGKGLSSPGKQPVLRPLVRQWLARNPATLAFCPARPCDGGSGALLVLLRS